MKLNKIIKVAPLALLLIYIGIGLFSPLCNVPSCQPLPYRGLVAHNKVKELGVSIRGKL